MNKIAVSFFLIFATLIFAQNAWKGSVEFKDGITCVHNPIQGMWDNDPSKKLTLEQIFSVGSLNADDDYLFSWVQDITTDSAGTIYVCDSQEHRIQVYNKSGEYIRTIGRQGQGPGDLMRPMAVRVGPDGRIYVQDDLNYRVSIFKSNGKFDHSFRYERFAGANLEIDPDGNVLLSMFGENKENNAPPIVTGYNLKGKTVRQFGEPLLLLEKDGYGKPYYDSNGFTFLKDGVLLVEFNSSYILHFYLNQKLIKVVDRKSDIFTKPEIIETIFKASTGEGSKVKSVLARSRIWKAFPLPSGRLAVFIQDRGKDFKDKTIGGRDFETVVDIFDDSGKFLKSYAWDWLNLGIIEHVDQEGYFYTNRGDSEIVPGVTKWRVAIE
ncbi:MAG: NHL repeat-containing protein [Candidatus Zhuqueibacterota bacterium]